MGRQRTHEEFISELAENKVSIEVIGNYTNTRSKIKCRCPICQSDWWVWPRNLLRGEYTSCCKGRETLKHSEEFRQAAASMGINVLGEYKNNHTKVRCICPICKETWDVIPKDVTSGKSKSCCSGRVKWDTKTFAKRALEMGIKVIGEYINITTKIRCKCPLCKNDWDVTPNDILTGNSTSCGCRTDYKKSYNERASKLGQTPLEDYIDYSTPILHKCNICGKPWKVSPSSILYGTSMCKECSNSLRESVMATVLKQVLQHEIGAIPEYDAGYRGQKGGVSCYNIYIPHLNTLVECQSEMHDGREDNDIRKRNYAISRGYTYIEMDSREYSPIQAVGKFIANIDKIPEYVDLSKCLWKVFPFEEAQHKLNEGMTYKEVASMFGVSYDTVQQHISSGRLIKPKYYKHGNFKHTQIVLQFGEKEEFIREVDLSTITPKNKYYHRKLMVVKACTSESHFYMGYYWYYADEYNEIVNTKINKIG